MLGCSDSWLKRLSCDPAFIAAIVKAKRSCIPKREKQLSHVSIHACMCELWVDLLIVLLLHFTIML